MLMEFAVVQRILEKHSSTALELCEQRLDISPLLPRPDTKSLLLSHELDDHRLHFDNLPDSVRTSSFKKYLQRASSSENDGTETDGTESAVTSVMYGMHYGTALAVFQQPYGR